MCWPFHDVKNGFILCKFHNYFFRLKAKIEQEFYVQRLKKKFYHSSWLDPLILVSYIFGLIQLHVYS